MSEFNINSQFTLLERAKITVDGKRVGKIIDVLDKFGVEEFMKDVPFFPANQGLKHRIVRTTSRPTSTRRRFYQGVGATQDTTQVIFEPVILFEQRSETDEDEFDTIEGGNNLRAKKDKVKVKAMMDDFVYGFFNDARTSGSEYINGLGARMTALSYPGFTTTSLPYVWDNKGTGDNLSSIYLIEYGEDACHGIFPSGAAVRGSIMGIIARNKGKEQILDSDDSTKKFYAYVSQFKFWWGLAVNNDWKIARIANIDIDETSSGALNENNIIKALNHGKFNKAATRMYVNPYIKTQIDIKAKDKNNVQWDLTNIFGREIPTFWGIPVRKLDETILSATEDQVT